MLKKLTLFLFLFISITKPLTSEEIHKIGMQIWQNEASGRKDLLVFWNKHEPFPSLGIGHCIWYPENYTGPYTQTFPDLCKYLQQYGITLPTWLDRAQDTGAPWKDREEFLKDRQKTEELRDLLASTVELQILFMMERFNSQKLLIIKHAPSAQRNKIIKIFSLMQETLLGAYALIDYSNFKGCGLNPKEVSKGHRWGLLQVLLNMPEDVTTQNVNKAFAVTAAQTLLILIKNSEPEYSRVKFMLGWMKRISTYADISLFNS